MQLDWWPGGRASEHRVTCARHFPAWWVPTQLRASVVRASGLTTFTTAENLPDMSGLKSTWQLPTLLNNRCLDDDDLFPIIPDKLQRDSVSQPPTHVHGLVCDKEGQHPLPLRWREILSTERQYTGRESGREGEGEGGREGGSARERGGPRFKQTEGPAKEGRDSQNPVERKRNGLADRSGGHVQNLWHRQVSMHRFVCLLTLCDAASHRKK